MSGSVRQRIERQQREAAERAVETPVRRVALGSSGPTMSTRQREQLAADHSEIVAPSHTRTRGTDFMSNNMSRVRDRQVAEAASKPEPLRPKTPTEQAADYYYALHIQELERKKADEQAKIAARQKREADERAAADLKQKRAVIAFQEAAVEREASDLTPDERSVFYQRLANANALLDAGAASVIAEKLINPPESSGLLECNPDSWSGELAADSTIGLQDAAKKFDIQADASTLRAAAVSFELQMKEHRRLGIAYH